MPVISKCLLCVLQHIFSLFSLNLSQTKAYDMWPERLIGHVGVVRVAWQMSDAFHVGGLDPRPFILSYTHFKPFSVGR